jgi:hypothetical protein
MTRPFQMKFNWENVLPGVSQPSADLQAQRSSLAQAARPTGHRSRMRETGADAADDEGLRVRALGPSDNPPEEAKSVSGPMFLELNNFRGHKGDCQ